MTTAEQDRLAEHFETLLDEHPFESDEVQTFLMRCSVMDSDTRVYLQQVYNLWVRRHNKEK